MALIDPVDVAAWSDGTKLTITSLDASLVSQIEVQVLSRLKGTYNTGAWTSTTNTPDLIRSIIAMMYMSWFYDRQYSEDKDNGNAWAARLAQMAEVLLLGLIDGTVDMSGVPPISSGDGTPAFYPNDAADWCDGPMFAMQQRF